MKAQRTRTNHEDIVMNGERETKTTLVKRSSLWVIIGTCTIEKELP